MKRTTTKIGVNHSKSWANRREIDTERKARLPVKPDGSSIYNLGMAVATPKTVPPPFLFLPSRWFAFLPPQPGHTHTHTPKRLCVRIDKSTTPLSACLSLLSLQWRENTPEGFPSAATSSNDTQHTHTHNSPGFSLFLFRFSYFSPARYILRTRSPSTDTHNSWRMSKSSTSLHSSLPMQKFLLLHVFAQLSTNTSLLISAEMNPQSRCVGKQRSAAQITQLKQRPTRTHCPSNTNGHWWRRDLRDDRKTNGFSSTCVCMFCPNRSHLTILSKRRP